MARTFIAAQYLSKATAIVTAAPFSFAGWFYCTNLASSNLGFIITTATGSDYFALNFDATGHPKAVAAQTGVGAQAAICASAIVASTWAHVACVFASNISRTIYLNGGAAVSQTVTCAPASITTSYVGGDPPSPFGDSWVGSIAFAAFWNVALTAADIVALNASAHPRLIRPASLIACLNMTGGNSPEPDLVSATAWTITGTPTVGVNPSIYM